MRQIALVSLVSLALSCGAPAAPEAPGLSAGAQPAAQGSFAEVRDSFIAGHAEMWPVGAAKAGLHEYDGKLPDASEAGLSKEIARLDRAIEQLEAVAPTGDVERLDHAVLLSEARGRRFLLRDWALLNKQPLAYLLSFLGGPDLLMYIVRDYAPAAQRAAGLAATCRAFPKFLASAKQNLPAEMPGPWIQMSTMVTGGLIELVSGAGAAFPSIPKDERAALDTSLGQCKAALTDFAAFLKSRKPNDDFRLGEKLYLGLLRETEGLEIDVKRLTEVAEADLARNLSALKAAAEGIDSKRSIAEIVAEATSDKPAPDGVVALATEQAKEQRRFVVEKKIATIPSDDVAEVRVTPPFMRFNLAFLDSAGPLEKKALPSYYYVTPPNPEWPEEKQRAYVPSRADLFYVTAHEVWPGHFLHALHRKRSESIASKLYCSTVMSEGWAHYTEEMMWQAGASGKDPKAHIGQLKNALLRNVRFVVSLGLHTGSMTVPEAVALFKSKAFQDEGNAMQQAVRGTMDPGYLSYTIGKLMIIKLREDWMAKQGPTATLQQFHDTFLSYQCAPVPEIRRLMLGPDAGPAL